MNTSRDMIERYVSGTLTTEERRLFEQQLTGDAQLAHQVRIEQSLFSAIAKDRTVLPIGSSIVPDTTLLAQLAETPAQTSLLGSAATAGGKAVLIFSSPWMINVLAGVALAGVVAGVLFIAPLLRQPKTIQPVVQRDTVYVPIAPKTPVIEPNSETAPVGESLRRTATSSQPVKHPAMQEKDVHSVLEETALQKLLEGEERKAPLDIHRTDSVRLHISIER